MSITIQQRQEYLELFIKTWPVERLKAMTLADYSSVGDKNSLIYWLEFGAGRYLGSIKGGDSSKFGIYERKAKPKGQREFISSDTRYSWKNKYGNSAEQAFAVIKKNIIDVIRAIQASDLETIEQLDFESALKWKLAFIYQNHTNPLVLPIYKLSKFKHFMAGKANYTHSDAYTKLSAERQGKPALEYGFELWQKADALEGKKSSDDFDTSEVEEDSSLSNQAIPLNQILFGPPGTGKTYETIRAALAILAPDAVTAYDLAIQNSKTFDEKQAAREALKTCFTKLQNEQRVRFVTFHQSFSYEDFVEGIRAEADDEGKLNYRIDSGVFKHICDDARAVSSPNLGISESPAIWKISINGAGDSPTKRYCFDHDEARIGWGETGDLRNLQKDNSYYHELSETNKGTLDNFAEQMAIGDILLCLHSAEEISAIGVVISDYRYESELDATLGLNSDYQHVRSVKWLYRDLKLSVLPLNGGVRLTQKSVYAMYRFNWPELWSYLERHQIRPAGNAMTPPGESKPYVLIIDEINRGNISRIFGELITLLEPSKREGAEEAITVTLPYSKKPFTVPNNVFVIGTMNTADRSLAGLDLALRRRFTFIEMPPRPELLDEVEVDGVNIGALLRVVNQRIAVLLDRDHCIGHAYFMPLLEQNSLPVLRDIFKQKIIPLLQEYFFEDWQRIRWVLNDQNKVDAAAFVVEDDQLSVETLFRGIESGLPNRTVWQLNEVAFDNIAAYQGIL